MKTLIFADVHLKVGEANRETLDECVAFLRAIDPAEIGRVVILGDLFDFWFEYRHVVFSGYFDVLRALADLHDRGIELHLVCGNHDFWAGRFFEEHLGVQVHPDTYRCMLGDRRALFVHGDGVNPSDLGYRIYKRVARSRLAIGLFSLLHPDWAMALAQFVSHSSHTLLAPADPAQSREVIALRAFAQGVIESGDADMVFCGHSHHPVEETIETPGGSGLYVNTGGWREHRTYLVWDGAGLTRFRGLPESAERSAIEEREEAPLVSVEVAQKKARES